MKKIFKNYAALAFGALVAVSMTACHHGDSEADATQVVVTPKTSMPTQAAKTLKVTLSKALPAGATLTYAGMTGTTTDGITYVWENVAEGGRLFLNGGGTVIDQEIKSLTFGDRNTIALDVDVVNKRTGTAITPTGANDQDQIIYEDDNTKATSDATLPASEAGTRLGQNFLVQMFVPAQEPITEKEIAQSEKTQKPIDDVAPIALNCEPDGAVFNPATPVTVTMNLPGMEETNPVLVNDGTGDEATGMLVGTTFTAQMDHFSIWNLILKMVVVSTEEASEEIGTYEFQAGKAEVKYQENFGFSSDATGILASTFRALFGAKETKVNKVYTFNTNVGGKIKFTQRYLNINMKSGNRTFTVKVWAGVDYEITYNQAAADDGSTIEVKPEEITPTHNGGSSSQPGV